MHYKVVILARAIVARKRVIHWIEQFIHGVMVTHAKAPAYAAARGGPISGSP